MERGREKEVERERQMALFKAKDASVLAKKPFLPRQCDKGPVRPIDSHLRTELRSEERRMFEQRLKEKEADMEAARQQVRHLLYLNFRASNEFKHTYNV